MDKCGHIILLDTIMWGTHLGAGHSNMSGSILIPIFLDTGITLLTLIVKNHLVKNRRKTRFFTYYMKLNVLFS